MSKHLSIEIDRHSDRTEQKITNHIFYLLNEINGVEVRSGYDTPD